MFAADRGRRGARGEQPCVKDGEQDGVGDEDDHRQAPRAVPSQRSSAALTKINSVSRIGIMMLNTA